MTVGHMNHVHLIGLPKADPCPAGRISMVSQLLHPKAAAIRRVPRAPVS